jgi:glycosyltransferase involved in cell wall biosynthesis
MTHAAPRVSVIIPVYDQPQALHRCLQALARQTCGREAFEAIVVDNGSIPPLPDLSREFPFARVAIEPRPGSYAARNHGLSLARGDVLAFTDADCEPADSWIEAGLRRLGTTPAAGFVAGRIVLRFASAAPVTAAELYEAVFGFPQEKYVGWGFAATANLFAPRATFDAVGAFDATLLSGGDMEWGQRVRRAGIPQVYAAEVLVTHDARRTLRELLTKARRVAGGVQRVADRRGEGTRELAMQSLRYVLAGARVRANLPHPAVNGLASTARFATAVWLVDLVQAFERYRVHAGGVASRR